MLNEDVMHMIWKKYYESHVLTLIRCLNKVLESRYVYENISIVTFESPVGYVNKDMLWTMGKHIWPEDVGYYSDIGQPYFVIRYHHKFKKCETIEMVGSLYYSAFTKSYKNILMNK